MYSIHIVTTMTRTFGSWSWTRTWKWSGRRNSESATDPTSSLTLLWIGLVSAKKGQKEDKYKKTSVTETLWLVVTQLLGLSTGTTWRSRLAFSLTAKNFQAFFTGLWIILYTLPCQKIKKGNYCRKEYFFKIDGATHQQVWRHTYGQPRGFDARCCRQKYHFSKHWHLFERIHCPGTSTMSAMGLPWMLTGTTWLLEGEQVLIFIFPLLKVRGWVRLRGDKCWRLE